MLKSAPGNRLARCLVALLPCLAVCPNAYSQIAPKADPDKLLAGNHFLRAEPLIRAALQRSPNDAHALTNLSVVDWAFNRLDTSLANAGKAAAAAPNSVEANAKLADALGSKLVSSNAGTFEKISLAHRFRKQLDRTLQLDPNDLDALQDLAQFYWHAPGMVGGDKNLARQTADKLFRISAFRGASARADFLTDDTDLNRRAAATVQVWSTAVAAAPNDYDARSGLAAALLEPAPAQAPNQAPDTSRLVEAESEARRALALDPTRIDAYNVLASVYARAGRWEQLDTVLKQARASVPDDRAPEYLAAATILSTNPAGSQPPQLSRAEQLLRDYLQQPAEGREPTHAFAHWRLGQTLEKQGRKADAIRELQTALQQDASLEGAKKDLKRLS